VHVRAPAAVGREDVHRRQRLMVHSDLSVLRQYLSRTKGDPREALDRAGEVDRLM